MRKPLIVSMHQYHVPTWFSVQIRMIAMGHWREDDAIPRIAYLRIHQYVRWVLEYGVRTGLPIDDCMLMHPVESLLWFDMYKWCRLLPRCQLTYEAVNDDLGEKPYETADDPDGLLEIMRSVPICIQLLVSHVDPSRSIKLSDRAIATIGGIIDMILIEEAYSAFVPEVLQA
jgi:hypothetical protein